jgi:aspartyl-tRNA synthetase
MSDPTLLRRTRGCGTLGEADADERLEVVLTGWVHRRRDLGRLIFLELRDATGIVQVVFDPSDSAERHAVAETLRAESVVGVRGLVARRSAPNPRLPTGQVEVRATALEVHNRAGTLPFPIAEEGEGPEANEEARLTHRYLDLRRPRLQHALRLRHRLSVAARRVLDASGFVEIETPILTRSTPEGARDYLVPSRVHRGSFYALPQSPQLFKQLLMIAGFDRYYQFARCFRDEDLRSDRQPEFTQIDLELSFVRPEDVYAVVEPLVVALFGEIGVTLEPPFPHLRYAEALERYGTDRPDVRFGLEIRDPGDVARGTGFRVFDQALESGGAVRGICVPGGAAASRKELDRYTDWVREAGGAGVVWIRLDPAKLASSALQALGAERTRAIAEALGAADGDLALLVADRLPMVRRVLGTLRSRIAAERGLIPAASFRLLWVEEFPLLEWDADAGRHVAVHHPFTAPAWDDLAALEDRPGDVRAQAYDLVLNGTEIAGGSIRIHRRDVQQRVFRALGIDDREADERFGFLLRALDAGAPPHGGIAFGFDRIAAMLASAESIRDVIAFPKTTSASCLMTGAPAPIDARQLAELGFGEPRK